MRPMRANGPIVASLAILLTGCGGPGPTLQPVVSSTSPSVVGATPSVQPTPSPIATVSSTPTMPPVAFESTGPANDPCPHHPDNGPYGVAPLLPGSAVKIAVTELNLRAGPCVAALKLGTLAKGKVLIVTDYLDGPVKADGLSWYRVVFPVNVLASGVLPKLPEQWFPDGTDTDGGWIAASSGSKAYLTPLVARCPTKVDLENLTAMLPSERLACFHAPIVLEGTYGCGGCGGEGGPINSPAWLSDTFEFLQLHVRWGDQFEFRPIGIHFPPSGPAVPKDGSIIRATVHVDDPAAKTCKFNWTIDLPFVVPAAAATAWCRERLVVDSYDVLGTDPSFPPIE
jgi:hypothetical protein